MLVRTYQLCIVAISGLILITDRLTYCQLCVLFGKLYLARKPVGSLVDIVLKVILLMQKLKMFLCSCYGPTESLCTEIELLLSWMAFFITHKDGILTATKSEWKHFTLGFVQVWSNAGGRRLWRIEPSNSIIISEKNRRCSLEAGRSVNWCGARSSQCDADTTQNPDLQTRCSSVLLNSAVLLQLHGGERASGVRTHTHTLGSHTCRFLSVVSYREKISLFTNFSTKYQTFHSY